MERNNIIMGKNYADCGCMIYDKTERVFMGGSGAGCSASVLNSYVINKIKNASIETLMEVEGISKKLAQNIYDYFHKD